MILDIGCGFAKDIHNKRGDIGIDINKGLCDICADAGHLPFKDNVFDGVYLYAILEHLDNPMKCLKESTRVAKDSAVFKILVPIDASVKVLLVTSVVEFPFGLLRCLRVIAKNSKRKRVRRFETPHKRQVTVKDVEKFLRMRKIEIRGSPHVYFTILQKISKHKFNKPVTVKSGRGYYLEAVKNT